MICIQQDVSPTCLIPMDDKQYVKPMEISRFPASKPFRYHRAQVVLPFERYSEMFGANVCFSMLTERPVHH